MHLSEINKKEIGVWICDFEIKVSLKNVNKMWIMSSKRKKKSPALSIHVSLHPNYDMTQFYI